MPAYRFDFEPLDSRVRVEFNAETVAESAAVMVLRETRLPPVYYFPRADVRMERLARTTHRTHCPFKGDASYWTLTAGEKSAENAAWSYEDPLPEAAAIRGYIAFYWNRMDHWYERGEEVRVRVACSETGLHPSPLADWLLSEAWEASSAEELVARLGRQLVEIGFPLRRLFMVIRTLHPQLTGSAYRWWRGDRAVTVSHVSHSMLTDPVYLDSPLLPIFQGAGGIRRRLEEPDAVLDFPILRELREQGITDYVAMPVLFSDGQVNIIVLGADAPGGFSTEHLGQLYEVLGALSRLFEVHALKARSTTLLQTYLGRQSGSRVLDGLVKRGDGDDIHAVIWFCDLRGSTALADRLLRQAFLELLNGYFDAMAGSVLAEGGEVLRFIGDAALAIFAIDGDGQSAGAAAARAVAAAREATRRMQTLNAERTADGLDALGFGIGLHLGDVTYGNIGSADRLEFTVIGSAANEAARIEGLCATLNRQVLASGALAAHLPGDFVSCGTHALRGLADPVEIFALEP